MIVCCLILLKCILKCVLTTFLQNKRNTISVAELNMRTTSSVESVNSIVQRSFPDRTNIFKFVESLKLFETIRSTDLHQLSKGEIRTPQLERKRAEDRARDEKIKRLSMSLKQKKIPIAEFLEEICTKDILPPISMYIHNASIKIYIF